MSCSEIIRMDIVFLSKFKECEGFLITFNPGVDGAFGWRVLVPFSSELFCFGYRIAFVVLF